MTLYEYTRGLDCLALEAGVGAVRHEVLDECAGVVGGGPPQPAACSRVHVEHVLAERTVAR